VCVCARALETEIVCEQVYVVADIIYSSYYTTTTTTTYNTTTIAATTILTIILLIYTTVYPLLYIGGPIVVERTRGF